MSAKRPFEIYWAGNIYPSDEDQQAEIELRLYENVDNIDNVDNVENVDNIDNVDNVDNVENVVNVINDVQGGFEVELYEDLENFQETEMAVRERVEMIRNAFANQNTEGFISTFSFFIHLNGFYLLFML